MRCLVWCFESKTTRSQRQSLRGASLLPSISLVEDLGRKPSSKQPVKRFELARRLCEINEEVRHWEDQAERLFRLCSALENSFLGKKLQIRKVERERLSQTILCDFHLLGHGLFHSATSISQTQGKEDHIGRDQLVRCTLGYLG
jgi:hypothetical protein